MILLRRTTGAGLDDDRIAREAASYEPEFRGRHVCFLIPRDLTVGQLRTLADDVRLLNSCCPLRLHLVVGDPGSPGWAPPDDAEAADAAAWDLAVACSAALRLQAVLERRGLSAVLMNPFEAPALAGSCDPEGPGSPEPFATGRYDRQSVLIWMPLVQLGGELRGVDPWRMAPQLAHWLDAIKLVILLPQEAAIDGGGGAVSSLTTVEVEDLVGQLRKRVDPGPTSRSRYHVTSALKAARAFVELDPARRRGHLVGCGRRAIPAELLTVDGVGTMVSDHALPGVGEPPAYGRGS